jgi:hypothetical protein
MKPERDRLVFEDLGVSTAVALDLIHLSGGYDDQASYPECSEPL